MVKKESKITRHFKVSVIKSVMRMVGFIALLSSLPIAVAMLIIAELVSIVEELV
jgi:ABC-type long-subunit fatty acid transport system fused permease/ATPase subunit